MKTGAVAIIGAGLSGLSCAQALRAAGVPVRIYESSGLVGGRCATRLWQGHLVDTGIQYFTAQSTEFKRELLTRLRQFRPIVSPIIDGDNKIVNNPAGPRFYVLQGNHYFAHVLSLGLDIRLNTPVETVSFTADGPECLGESYRAVVSSLPGPLTARLFGLSQSPVEYHPCLVALLEYPGDISAHECYGHLAPASHETLLSSYCENNKAARIVGHKTVFVVQASPRFSRENAGTPPENFLPALIREHENLWRIPSGQCSASFSHLWPHGRPTELQRHRVDLPHGAFYCGDSRAESCVEPVWLDGRKTAHEVLSFLAE